MTTFAAWTVAPRSPTNRPRNWCSLPSSMVISCSFTSGSGPKLGAGPGTQAPANHGVLRLPCPAVGALGPHRLAQLHPGEPGRPVAGAVAGAQVGVVQLDLHQPPHENLARRELGEVQRLHLALPAVLGHGRGRGPEGAGARHDVGEQLGRAPAGTPLDRLVAGL